MLKIVYLSVSDISLSEIISESPTHLIWNLILLFKVEIIRILDSILNKFVARLASLYLEI